MHASTPKPEAGAQCGNPARWDLCGGPPVRAVPTAIEEQREGRPPAVVFDNEVVDEQGAAGLERSTKLGEHRHVVVRAFAVRDGGVHADVVGGGAEVSGMQV